MAWDNKDFKSSWIRDEITPETVSFAELFGRKLASNSKRKEKRFSKKEGREVEFEVEEVKLTTSQLRKFFGEVKRFVDMDYFKEIESFVRANPDSPFLR